MIDSLLKIKNYKCIGEEYQGFDSIFPINIIIGRNNAGKSTLLDILESFCNSDSKNDENVYLYSKKLTEMDISKGFRKGTSGGGLPGDHWQYGQNYLNARMIIEVYKETKTMKEIGVNLNNPYAEGYLVKVSNVLDISLREFKTKRIRAERHIVPETDDDIAVKENGVGATNIIQRFINKSNLPSELIEKKLLNELNKIFEPDLKIMDIVVQQTGAFWEIYLEEESKGRIALSSSGSGIQTVLLVLIYLYLIPKIENKKPSNYFFLFEELENNVHPALLRRLFMYLRNFALENSTYFFITTHSNVIIDAFNKDESAQILHVQHNGKNAFVKKVEAFIEKKGVLDDLDIRASDLLQSNGIIWVEGPSDRIYLNHWIELFTNGTIKENIHYQIVFYGGRLLAHLSADATDNASINILNVNTNCILLMDSDKRYLTAPLNDTKKRIIKEIKPVNGYVWVTKGREIENYIPNESLKTFLDLKSLPAVSQFESVRDYMVKVKKKIGKKYYVNKVLLAEDIRQFITNGNFISNYDLEIQLKTIITHIKKWNGILMK